MPVAFLSSSYHVVNRAIAVDYTLILPKKTALLFVEIAKKDRVLLAMCQ